MRLKHIEVFNAVMLTGSASGAARLLHVTQPAVTQTLQHAELQLGFPLFTRQRNRLVPTAEAAALYPEVRTLMSQVESVRRLAAGLRRGGEGTELRVLVVHSLAAHALPKALSRVRARHAALPIAIRTLHSREIVEAIALREADVGIVYGEAAHPAVIAEPLAQGRLVCVARGARRGAIALADLVREPFVRIDEQDPLGAMLAEQCAREGLVPAAGITVQTYHVALALAAEGFGPAVVDSFTAAAAPAGLQVRPLTPEVPVRLHAVLPQNAALRREVADVVEAFRAAVSG